MLFLEVMPLGGVEILSHVHKTGSLYLQRIPICSVIHRKIDRSHCHAIKKKNQKPLSG